MAQVSWAVRLLERALPMLGVTSPVGKDVMSAMKSLAKHVPPGAASAGVENNALQQMMLQGKQEQPMVQALRAMGQGGAPGMGAMGAMGAAGGGAPPAGAGASGM